MAGGFVLIYYKGNVFVIVIPELKVLGILSEPGL